jgi:hypothetical protein
MVQGNNSGELESRVDGNRHVIEASPDDMARETNTPSVVTITPSATEQVLIASVDWSYSATPTGGNIKIEGGGNTYWQWDITAGGPGFREWKRPKKFPLGEEITITVAAGGGGIVGTCNSEHWKEE